MIVRLGLSAICAGILVAQSQLAGVSQECFFSSSSKARAICGCTSYASTTCNTSCVAMTKLQSNCRIDNCKCPSQYTTKDGFKFDCGARYPGETCTPTCPDGTSFAPPAVLLCRCTSTCTWGFQGTPFPTPTCRKKCITPQNINWTIVDPNIDRQSPFVFSPCNSSTSCNVSGITCKSGMAPINGGAAQLRCDNGTFMKPTVAVCGNITCGEPSSQLFSISCPSSTRPDNRYENGTVCSVYCSPTSVGEATQTAALRCLNGAWNYNNVCGRSCRAGNDVDPELSLPQICVSGFGEECALSHASTRLERKCLPRSYAKCTDQCGADDICFPNGYVTPIQSRILFDGCVSSNISEVARWATDCYINIDGQGFKSIPTIPHGQQCKVLCPSGYVRTGSDGPYCFNGTFVWFDRRGKILDHTRCNPKTIVVIPGLTALQCKLAEGRALEKQGNGKNGNTAIELYDAMSKIDYKPYPLDPSVRIVFPKCTDLMSDGEVASLACPPGSRLEGADYIQCHRGTLKLGGNSELLNYTSSRCIRMNLTTVPGKCVARSAIEIAKILLSPPGSVKSDCPEGSMGDFCTVSCNKGFVLRTSYDSPSASSFSSFSVVPSARLQCKKIGGAEEFGFEDGMPTFTCVDQCRGNPFNRTDTRYSPGGCDPQFLCDGICSAYLPLSKAPANATLNNVDCTGPACDYDSSRCTRTKLAANNGFNVTVIVDEVTVSAKFSGRLPGNAWIGLYMRDKNSNVLPVHHDFIHARHIVLTGDNSFRAAFSLAPIQWRGSSLASLDFSKTDLEVRVFSDLRVGNSTGTENFLGSTSMCWADICGKPKKSKFSTMTESLYSLLEVERHRDNHNEWAKRMSIVKDFSEASEEERPMESVFQRISDIGEDSRVILGKLAKSRREQLLDIHFSGSYVPDRCLIERPDCSCDKYSNLECNAECNNEACNFDNYRCNCPALSSAAALLLNVISADKYVCHNNHGPSNISDGSASIGTSCEIECLNGTRMLSAGGGRAVCVASEAGGKWTGGCYKDCSNLQVLESRGFLGFGDMSGTMCNDPEAHWVNGRACEYTCKNGTGVMNPEIKNLLKCTADGNSGQWSIDGIVNKRFCINSTVCTIPALTNLGAASGFINTSLCGVNEGASCPITCTPPRTPSATGVQKVTCTNGQWVTSGPLCVEACKVPDRWVAGGYSMDCSKMYYTNSSTCDLKCSPQTSMWEAGAKLYNGQSCPGKALCTQGLSFEWQDNTILPINSQSCMSNCTCDTGSLPTRLASSGYSCDPSMTSVPHGSRASIRCNGTLVDSPNLPVCFDGIFVLTDKQGEALQLVCIPPPVVPPGNAQCTYSSFLDFINSPTRNWFIQDERNFIDRCTNAWNSLNHGEVVNATVLCNPKTGGSIDGGPVKIACQNGVFQLVGECKKDKCPTVSIPNGVLKEVEVGGGGADAIVCDPGFTPVFKKNSGAWVWGPYCGPTAEWVLSQNVSCVDSCQGNAETGGVCDVLQHKQQLCDWFCDGQGNEVDCTAKSCSRYIEHNCIASTLTELNVYPSQITLKYTTASPLTRNARLHVKSGNTAYGYFIPSPEGDPDGPTTATVTLKQLLDPSAFTSGLRELKSTTNPNHEFTFFQDLLEVPLATVSVCGGLKGQCSAIAPLPLTPEAPRQQDPHPPGCAAVGCSCTQLGDGVCDIQCLFPACGTKELTDCGCDNDAALSVTGGVVADCPPGKKYPVNTTCSITCPDGLQPLSGVPASKTSVPVSKITCQQPPQMRTEGGSWSTAYCPKRCFGFPAVNFSLPYLANIVWDPACDGSKHGQVCRYKCGANGTFVDGPFCSDGKWNGLAYCSGCAVEKLYKSQIQAQVLNCQKSEVVQTGKVCQAICRPGFLPVNSATCQASGQFDQMSPSCIQGNVCTLGLLDSIRNSKVERSDSTCNATWNATLSDWTVPNGSKCRVTCLSGAFERTGADAVECQRGQWTLMNTLDQPWCHAPCTNAALINGGTSTCSEFGSLVKVWSECTRWSCNAPTFKQDRCTKQARPVCMHGGMRDIGLPCETASGCLDLCKKKGCPFSAFISPSRYWSLTSANIAADWNHTLPYCFASCPRSVLPVRDNVLGCLKDGKVVDLVSHGEMCNVSCAPGTRWSPIFAGEYENIKAPFCFDGLFIGPSGRCEVAKSTPPVATFCSYLDLHQMLGARNFMGIDCQELVPVNTTLTANCTSGRLVRLVGLTNVTTAATSIVAKCTSNPKCPGCNGTWVLHRGDTMEATDSAPECSVLECDALVVENSVRNSNNVTCPAGVPGSDCLVKCQEGYAIVWAGDVDDRKFGPICGDGWQSVPQCLRKCSEAMLCTDSEFTVSNEKAYSTRCDSVCETLLVGGARSKIDCAGPACDFDAGECGSVASLFAVNLNVINLTYAVNVVIPPGKRLTSKAWLGLFRSGEQDHYRWLHYKTIPSCNSGCVVNLVVPASEGNSSLEVRAFPDVMNKQPIFTLGITPPAQKALPNLPAGSPGNSSLPLPRTVSGAASQRRTVGIWRVLAIVFIALFAFSLVTIAVLVVKLRRLYSGGHLTKYGEPML